MKTKLTILSFILVVSVSFFSCEDKINPALEYAAPLLVVDAWLNNKPGSQVIILTKTQPYFESALPPGVSNAIVTVTDDKGNTFLFTEDNARKGYYVWTPPANSVFGTVGNKYTLSIDVEGEKYQSSSRMGRVPPIDSITYDIQKRIGSKDSVTRGEFWATDPAGVGDAYWIRTTKNGVPLNKPSEINIAYDGGLTAGGIADGVIFITPIRRGINSRDEAVNGTQPSPIKDGDSLNVQIHSVTLEAFNYLNQVAIQTDRPGGFQELFSTPLANVSTNVSNINPAGSKVLGFFNVSAVSTKGKRYKKR